MVTSLHGVHKVATFSLEDLCVKVDLLHIKCRVKSIVVALGDLWGILKEGVLRSRLVTILSMTFLLLWLLLLPWARGSDSKG